jgi:hypothetical protein
MFEKDNQLFIQPDDTFEVFVAAYERLLAQRAGESLERERAGKYDDSWHNTPYLVGDKERLQDPENIPWRDDGVYELNATPEQLISGLNLVLTPEQPEVFTSLTPEQKEKAVGYLRELKGLKVADSFTWRAAQAER